MSPIAQARPFPFCKQDNTIPRVVFGCLNVNRIESQCARRNSKFREIVLIWIPDIRNGCAKHMGLGRRRCVRTNGAGTKQILIRIGVRGKVRAPNVGRQSGSMNSLLPPQEGAIHDGGRGHDASCRWSGPHRSCGARPLPRGQRNAPEWVVVICLVKPPPPGRDRHAQCLQRAIAQP